MSRCRVVGLTGGIASGKSTVAKLFEAHGIAVLDADQTARVVVASGSEGFEQVVQLFGDDVVAADGELDRAALRRRVFGDDEARRELEAIIHPKVRHAMAAWVTAQQSTDAPYCALMIPLLVESGLQAMVESVVVVDVSVETQRRRLTARDDIDDALANRMITAQAARENRLEAADIVIDNNGAPDALHRQVLDAHAVLSAAKATERSN